MEQSFEYYNYIHDDSDGESTIEYDEGDIDDNGHLDTKWIATCEEQLLLDEYDLFLKSDIVRVSFQFVYLNRENSGVESVVRMNESYILQTANQITQNELLRIIHKFQNKGNKKYYNFKSLLLYDFQMPETNENDDVKWLSEYLYSSSASSASSATTHQLQQRAPYIIHHLIGTYLLYDTLMSDNTGPLLHAYYLLEASNIMIYVSYHLHKEYRAYKTVISFAEFIQLLWYSYYRVYRFSSLVYNDQPRFFEFSRTSQCFIVILYTMGVVWTCKLVKRNIGNLSIFYSNNM